MDPSIGANSSRAVPLAVGGVNGADAEVYPIIAVTEEALTVIFPNCPNPDDGDTVASGCSASVTGMTIFVCTDSAPFAPLPSAA